MSLVLVAIEDRGDDGTVARVTVNNPEQHNALGNAGKRELAEAIEAVSADERLRVIVLTGAGGRSFIGGANITEMATFERHHAMEGPGLTHRVCDAIRRAPVPVIARVNGWCLGAGLEIAASCDMRAAVDTARFGMPEVLFGLPSGMEACLLPQLIGWGKTRELKENHNVEQASHRASFPVLGPSGIGRCGTRICRFGGCRIGGGQQERNFGRPDASSQHDTL